LLAAGADVADSATVRAEDNVCLLPRAVDYVIVLPAHAAAVSPHPPHPSRSLDKLTLSHRYMPRAAAVFSLNIFLRSLATTVYVRSFSRRAAGTSGRLTRSESD